MNPFIADKILRHIDRISEWINTGISHPITYELDMTNICNSKCSFCFGFYERENRKDKITFEEAKDIVLQIKNFGGKGLIFTGGGEPLCNNDTIKVVEYANSIGLEVGFITNGILIDNFVAEVLVKNCKWIRISLDAGSKETYYITHGLDSNIFYEVIKNIKLLVETKKRLGSKTIIGTGFLTFDKVSDVMENFVIISKDCGVDYAQFRPLLKNFYAKELDFVKNKDLVLKIDELKKYSTTTFNVVSSEHKYNKIFNRNVSRKYKKCYGHNFATVVAADKKMYLCCHTRGIEKYCIGDLSKNTLEEIWFSEQRKLVAEKINFSDCPLLCRCDNINETLWFLKQKGEHDNFL